MELCVEHIAPGWQTRPFTEAAIPAILKLCRGNHACYRHMGMEPTAGNLREVFNALPPGKGPGYRAAVAERTLGERDGGQA